MALIREVGSIGLWVKTVWFPQLHFRKIDVHDVHQLIPHSENEAFES